MQCPEGRRGGMAGSRRLRIVVPALVVGVLTAGIVSLRRDPSPLVLEVRGTFGAARVLEEERTETGTVSLLELVNDRGAAASTAYLRRPRRLSPQCHALVTYTGVGTRRRILELIPERPDVLLLAVQYPYRPPEGVLGRLRMPYDVRRAVYRTVAAGMLGVDHLIEDEGLDAARITVLGASIGAPFAVLHGALDERVPRVLVVHGGGDLPAMLRYQSTQRGRPWRGLALGLAAEIFVESFDPIRFVGRIAPREVVIVGARHDRQFPEASVEALWDHARQPKRLYWTDTGHVGSRPSEIVDELVTIIDRYLDEVGPRLAASAAPCGRKRATG